MRSALSIKILVGGEVKTLKSADADQYGEVKGKKILDDNIFYRQCLESKYNSPIFNGVLSNVSVEDVKKAVTKEFLTQTNAAFDFVARKRSEEKRERAALIKAINRLFDY